MRVKVIEEDNAELFERAVNEFISNEYVAISVREIKYKIFASGLNNNRITYVAIISY